MAKSRIWIAIALCHLALMTLGAAYVPLEEIPLIGPVIGYYGDLSGATRTYGFFAPGLDGQIRAVFDVIDSNGNTKTVHLETGASHEADLRVGDIVDQFTLEENDTEEFRRSMAASLAGTVFGRYPDARQVVVRVQEMLPVSMAEYREGKRQQWDTLYEAKFEHHSKKKRDAE